MIDTVKVSKWLHGQVTIIIFDAPNHNLYGLQNVNWKITGQAEMALINIATAEGYKHTEFLLEEARELYSFLLEQDWDTTKDGFLDSSDLLEKYKKGGEIPTDKKNPQQKFFSGGQNIVFNSSLWIKQSLNKV
jgi:hypothetical protein